MTRNKEQTIGLRGEALERLIQFSMACNRIRFEKDGQSDPKSIPGESNAVATTTPDSSKKAVTPDSL